MRLGEKLSRDLDALFIPLGPGRFDLLLVLTADHPMQKIPLFKQIPWLTEDELGGIPLVFLTPQTLPSVDRTRPACQLDFAPTLYHMMGWEIPRGWWGESLFHPGRRDNLIQTLWESTIVNTTDGPTRIKLWEPRDDSERRFLRLFNTLITRPREQSLGPIDHPVEAELPGPRE